MTYIDINESMRIINEANHCHSVTIKEYVTCPFCGGTKTTPFTSWMKNQKCTECNKNGQITKSKLKLLDLD